MANWGLGRHLVGEACRLPLEFRGRVPVPVAAGWRSGEGLVTMKALSRLPGRVSPAVPWGLS